MMFFSEVHQKHSTSKSMVNSVKCSNDMSLLLSCYVFSRILSFFHFLFASLKPPACVSPHGGHMCSFTVASRHVPISGPVTLLWTRHVSKTDTHAHIQIHNPLSQGAIGGQPTEQPASIRQILSYMHLAFRFFLTLYFHKVCYKQVLGFSLSVTAWFLECTWGKVCLKAVLNFILLVSVLYPWPAV